MDEKRFQNSTMQNFHEIEEYLPILLEGEVAIAFTTLNNYLFTKSTDFCQMDETPEAELAESLKQMIRAGEVYIGEYSKDVQIPFKSYTIPVRGENGKVEGAILLAKSLDKKREVQNAFDTIKASLEQITLAISDLNVNIQEVVETNGAILNIVREANEKTADTNGILNFIQEVSSQTNLLGLNAAIEAARAGEYGRGFDVVAKEIRKLSSSTTDSIKKVDTVLNNISDSIKTINEKVGESNGVFEVQASSLEEIAASIEELNSSTQIISGFIDKL